MESKYLEFVQTDNTGKTDKWAIYSKSNNFLLGTIKWHGQWRQYCFFPQGLTVFNIGCMQDICQFIKNMMDKRRQVNED